MKVEFLPPVAGPVNGSHHAQAAAANAIVADSAQGVLRDALSGEVAVDRLLLRAAAGAGKSFLLKRLVADAITHPGVSRVVVTAFTNKQTHPIARDLGLELGADRVALLVAANRLGEVPDDTRDAATVVSDVASIPPTAIVVIAPIHKLGSHYASQFNSTLGAGANGNAPFDVLLVDEAWQVANHLFDKVSRLAPLWVGVGDVGQLPPLEIGANPWRSDTGYNPYRAWPTAFESGDRKTSVHELPSVWRPPAGSLALWRAFYPDWSELNSVVAPEDRWVEFESMSPVATTIWKQVAAGIPTLLEVDGLPDPDAADVDLPLTKFIESLVDELMGADVRFYSRMLDRHGSPTTEIKIATPLETHNHPLVAILATRNQARDDLEEMTNRLIKRHSLASDVVVPSTVDSWQGQTNAFTVAIHPLSGAASLDEFNSAFGRLAVMCTRATHGTLLVSRSGLDTLLAEAPARPGTPLGEPGFRTLPRQTHERILEAFARGRLTVTVVNE